MTNDNHAYDLKWSEGDSVPLIVEQILQHDKEYHNEKLSFNNWIHGFKNQSLKDNF